MERTPKNILIVTKTGHPEASALGAEIASWLESRGLSAQVAEHQPVCYENGPCQGEYDLALVLGGDGTMISVARAVAGRMPLLGLNLGRLGFLTDLTTENWQQGLKDMFGAGLNWTERMTLKYEVLRQGAVVAAGRVINDIVFNRGALARLIRLRLELSGELLGDMRADGLVVATPTGSTAYSISSGGPIVHPGLESFSVTPICPFLHNFKPMVLPGDAELRVGVVEATADVFATLDGQDGMPLEEGDVVSIRRASQGMKLVELGALTYVERLRAKGVIE